MKALITVTLISLAVIAAEPPLDTGDVHALERSLQSTNELDLAAFKRAWQRITEEYTSPRNEPKDSVFRERIHAMEKRAENLLVARFTDVVERREIDEAIEIFTHFGASEIQTRLVAVLRNVDDRKFVARIVHAELSPSKWSDDARRNHADGFSPDSVGPIRRLYFDLLDESADVPIVFPGGIMDETYRPFREKLEGKYPSLLERNTGSRFEPPSPEGPQSTQPHAPRTRRSSP